MNPNLEKFPFIDKVLADFRAGNEMSPGTSIVDMLLLASNGKSMLVAKLILHH